MLGQKADDVIYWAGQLVTVMYIGSLSEAHWAWSTTSKPRYATSTVTDTAMLGSVFTCWCGYSLYSTLIANICHFTVYWLVVLCCLLRYELPSICQYAQLLKVKKKFLQEITENAAHNYKAGSHYLKDGSAISNDFILLCCVVFVRAFVWNALRLYVNSITNKLSVIFHS